MSELIKAKRIKQIAFVVRDLEASSKRFAEMFGMPIPKIMETNNYELIKTEYRGEPSKEAAQRTAFFSFENIQVELIEPNEHPSTWREFLDTHGEGIHHLAFESDDTEADIKKFEEKGMGLLQKGTFKNQGGRYAYLDTDKEAHFTVELLESFNKKK